jgi:hypothetical protein
MFLVCVRNNLQNSFTAVFQRDTNTSCVIKLFHSVYCCLIRYVLVRIRNDKCLSSSKRFRCEVVFENGLLFVDKSCSLLCTWREQRPSNKGDLDSECHGKSLLPWVDVLLVSFFFPAVRNYFWVCSLNGTFCVTSVHCGRTSASCDPSALL